MNINLKTADWENEYPLNTFHGTTKKELVSFICEQITKVLEEQKIKIKNEVVGLRREYANTPTKDRGNGWSWLDKVSELPSLKSIK